MTWNTARVVAKTNDLKQVRIEEHTNGDCTMYVGTEDGGVVLHHRVRLNARQRENTSEALEPRYGAEFRPKDEVRH